jgi:HEAT repeat protein
MLSPEQAQERLKAFQNPHYKRDQLKRVVFLWGNLSTIGQILIQAGPAWNKVANNWEQINRVQTETLHQLGKLRQGERIKLFEALFPWLSSYVESTWKLFDILPYQTGLSRRPFRNPDHYSPGARAAWLQHLLLAISGYEQDVVWFAAWAPHLGYGGYLVYGAPNALGYLFAGTIENGGKAGQEVFDTLIASANGSHEIGMMGRHVVRGLMCTSRRDGWDYIERLLLAAQREEGLRQVILESVDEAHPELFKRLLCTILDHNLSRFSAAIRAFDVWFGLELGTVPQKSVADSLARVLCYLEDSSKREKAIRDGSALEAYYALWAMAFEDASATLPHAITLRQSPDVERRFAVTHLLAQMDLVGSFEELLNALEDPDLRVATRAIINLNPPEYNRELLKKSDLFERLERLIARLPHKQNTLKPLVWEWMTLQVDREMLAGRLIECLGNRSPKRLIPYLSHMNPTNRFRVAHLLETLGGKDEEARQVLFTLAGDRSPYVREQSLKALQGYKLTEAEILQIESLLTRKAEDLRRGVIQLLLELPDKTLLQSINRLLGLKNENQRRAGLEILRESIRSKRLLREGRLLASEFEKRAVVLQSEARVLEEILADETEEVSLDDALGLMNPENRSQSKPPPSDTPWFGRGKKVQLGSSAAVEILKSLDSLIEKHRIDPVELSFSETKRTELLGNIRFGFPKTDPSQPLELDLTRLPLKEVWETWWQTRPADLRDPDGCELIRASAILRLFSTRWINLSRAVSEVPKDLQTVFEIHCNFNLHYESIISSVLDWMIRSHPVKDDVSFLLDALETSVSRIPNAELTGVNELYVGMRTRAISLQRLAYLHICRWHRQIRSEAWQDEHHARLWAVVRWLDEPKPGLLRYRPNLEDALFAQRAGAASWDDLLDLLLGPREIEGYGNHFHILQELSGRIPHPYFKAFPGLKDLVDNCRERILSVETRRGDLPTAASLPAMALRSIPGMKNLFRLLVALGKTDFERGYHFGQSRQAVLSHLIRVTYPIEEDTREGFAELAHTSNISDRRLVELAMYAPQWSGFVEYTLNWPKFQEAVFWVYAHTKDRQWTVEKEIRELWTAQVSEYTPLSADSLMDGAVDVNWFHQAYAALGEDRWKEVYRAAILTAVGKGHIRARIFADAMLGKVTADELIERIMKKRHQDSLRAFGLVPVQQGDDFQRELLRRYEVMQEFLRTSKKFGSQRQASEKLAVAIGMENLARNAGYTDPQRLEWAMEVEAVADLANGPVSIEVAGTRVSLSIDDLGEPELVVSKKGKQLKAIPAAVKKDEQIASLLDRKRKLDRQTSRMRQSLEQAMCRGDTFTGAEVWNLFRHPMLSAMLEQLVFIGPKGMGYPVENGRALFAHSGRMIPVAPVDELRIAHPIDLLESDEWHFWQHECFISERIQPFKQVFRELYILTPTEKEERNLSRRYAGQQVNPRQALALFSARGWVTDPEEGVHKTFHDLGISARVGFLQGIFTPAEVEGLTLEVVVFTQRGDWSPLPLIQIAPRVFSEVMRDLDLVVSVAHAGGVDPEASASSIEAREALIRETCNLLSLQNVRVKDRHAIVEGKLGNYTIHLGSAVVHKQPGGSLCIIPVHSQHRGRLFLPFVDSDPKSAEIISKVISLAKDSEIKDPTILEQILN